MLRRETLIVMLLLAGPVILCGSVLLAGCEQGVYPQKAHLGELRFLKADVDCFTWKLSL